MRSVQDHDPVHSSLSFPHPSVKCVGAPICATASFYAKILCGFLGLDSYAYSYEPFPHVSRHAWPATYHSGLGGYLAFRSNQLRMEMLRRGH